ncbi:MAG: DNA-3-methyladenine glycosylase I, partial [Oleiphilaceae bacterium]
MPIADKNETVPASGRCPWCGTDPFYVNYHDTVWGRPEYDNLALFEKLCLDGQQAGLSWITILRKQENYQAAYDYFDPEKIVQYDDKKVSELLANPGIVRNKLKVQSIIKNAKGYLDLQEKGTEFSRFLWSFVEDNPIQNSWRSIEEVPVTTAESEAMS